MLLKDFSYEIASICMAIVIEYYFRPYTIILLGGNKMKKLIALLLALVMVIGLVACGNADAPAADAPAADAPP